jgi:hypothetical protein
MSDEENWYVLKIDDIDSKISDLTNMGVPCSIIDKNNMTFPSSFVSTVLGYLGDQSRLYSLESTSIKNTFIMKFIDPIDEINFERPINHFEGWNDMIPVMRAVYEIFGVRIAPANPHGITRGPFPSTDDMLYVHFYSTSLPSKKTKMNSVVFGIRLTTNQSYALYPSNVGIAIKDEAGTIVAEYVNDNLYVLFDLPHAEGDNVTELFTLLMRSYFKLRGRADGELVNFYQSIRGKLGASSEDEFINQCSKLYVKDFKSMEESLKTYDAKIDDYSKNLISLKRDREILLMKLEPLRSSVDGRREWARTEYETLLASPCVKDVLVNGRTIHIFTTMISIPYNGEIYDIGEFKIDIYTDGSNNSVRAFNLTNPKGGAVAHPHVKIDGYCCLGNVSDGVSKLLAEYQYVILAQLMISFLQSYNPDNAYGKISLWKKADH